MTYDGLTDKKNGLTDKTGRQIEKMTAPSDRPSKDNYNKPLFTTRVNSFQIDPNKSNVTL